MTAKTVCHIGPIHDDGGMAAVIDSISSMDIEGWTSLCLNSYNRNPFWSRFSLVPTVLNKLSTSLKKQDLDAVHIHVTHGMSWFRKHFFIRWCIKKNVPLILHIHSGRPQEVIRKAMKILDKTKNSNLVKVVVLENRWLDHFPSDYRDRVSIIHNAPRPLFASNSVSNENLTFGVFCRPVKHKRHDIALKALNALREKDIQVKMIVTGNPFDDPPSWVEQHGWVSTDELRTIMEKCRFLLQTSQSEGSSMSVIEAMSMGLLPIVSEASSETVGDHGVVVKGEDPLEWASVIESEIIRIQDNKNGAKELRNPYNRAEIAAAWRTIYDSSVHQG